MRGDPVYTAWIEMKRRCFAKKRPSFKDYGGRGIHVHPPWVNSFLAFYRYIGPHPGPGFSLERKKNDQGYEPGNVMWATKKEQARNQRSNRLLTFEGKTQCVAAWAEQIGCSPEALHQRLVRGWSVERALTASWTLTAPWTASERADKARLQPRSGGRFV